MDPFDPVGLEPWDFSKEELKRAAKILRSSCKDCPEINNRPSPLTEDELRKIREFEEKNKGPKLRKFFKGVGYAALGVAGFVFAPGIFSIALALLIPITVCLAIAALLLFLVITIFRRLSHGKPKDGTA